MIYKGRSCRGFYKICRAPNPDIIKQRGLKSYITFSTALQAAGIQLTNKSVFTAFGLLRGEVNHSGGGEGERKPEIKWQFLSVTATRGGGTTGSLHPTAGHGSSDAMGAGMQWVQGCSGCTDAMGEGKQQVQQCCGCSRCSSWVAVLQAQRCSLQMDVHGVQTPPRCPEQQTEHGKNKTTPQPHQGRRFACEAFRTRPTGTHPFNTGVPSPHPPPPQQHSLCSAPGAAQSPQAAPAARSSPDLGSDFACSHRSPAPQPMGPSPERY